MTIIVIKTLAESFNSIILFNYYWVPVILLEIKNKVVLTSYDIAHSTNFNFSNNII